MKKSPRKRVYGFLVCAAAAALIYFAVSYLLLPDVWQHYEHHPMMENAPKITFTKEGIPGDPLNVGLLGTRDEVRTALKRAGWKEPDSLTPGSEVRIAESVLLREPYPEAPVSRLYLWGRPQDLSFEKEEGSSAAKRHHVRLWQSRELGLDGRPLWIGAATFDRAVGFSRTTGEITHHIDADIDRERDLLIADLLQAGQLSRLYQVTGVGPTLQGRNGARDRYFTDGELTLAAVAENNEAVKEAPERIPSPLPVELKNKLWFYSRNLTGKNGALQ